MRSESFFARGCFALAAITPTARVSSRPLRPVERCSTPYPSQTLLARATASGGGSLTTHPIPTIAALPSIPSTHITHLSAPSHTPQSLTSLPPPTLHNFTHTPLTNSDVSHPDTSDQRSSCKSIIGMSIALAVILTALLATIFGLLIHCLGQRRARGRNDVEASARRGVPPMAQMAAEMGTSAVPRAVQPSSAARLAAELREVRMNQVPPRMMGGRDVAMVNREEPESRRREWQEECEMGKTRGVKGKFTEEGLEDVDLGAGSQRRGRGRKGGWAWGFPAGV